MPKPREPVPEIASSGTGIAARALAARELSSTIGGKRYVVERQITFPQLKQKDNQSVAVKFDGPIYEGEEVKDATGKVSKAKLAIVTNLEDGKQYQYIITAIVEANLTKKYPDDSYVGHMFAINKLSAAEGKRYKQMEILEIKEAE